MPARMSLQVAAAEVADVGAGEGLALAVAAARIGEEDDNSRRGRGRRWCLARRSSASFAAAGPPCTLVDHRRLAWRRGARARAASPGRCRGRSCQLRLRAVTSGAQRIIVVRDLARSGRRRRRRSPARARNPGATKATMRPSAERRETRVAGGDRHRARPERLRRRRVRRRTARSPLRSPISAEPTRPARPHSSEVKRAAIAGRAVDRLAAGDRHRVDVAADRAEVAHDARR